jgi:hypothetical protein
MRCWQHSATITLPALSALSALKPHKLVSCCTLCCEHRHSLFSCDRPVALCARFKMQHFGGMQGISRQFRVKTQSLCV